MDRGGGLNEVAATAFLERMVACAEEPGPRLDTALRGSAVGQHEFGRWVKSCRPPPWLLRVVEFLPMSTAVHDELLRYMIAKTDDPEVRARQKLIGKVYLEMTPELSDEVFEKGLDKGLDRGLEPLAHQFERRLSRRLGDEERRALHERLLRLGPERLGDVVLDLAPEALAAWLADPDAR